MINIAEHCSVYYAEHCIVCYITSLYKSILTYDKCCVTYLLCTCRLAGLLARQQFLVFYVFQSPVATVTT